MITSLDMLFLVLFVTQGRKPAFLSQESAVSCDCGAFFSDLALCENLMAQYQNVLEEWN